MSFAFTFEPIAFPVASIFQGLPLDALVSTQGIMVMLLVAYAGAMWAFLSSAPKVHTVMVSDLDTARQFYEGMLSLSAADVPLALLLQLRANARCERHGSDVDVGARRIGRQRGGCL